MRNWKIATMAICVLAAVLFAGCGADEPSVAATNGVTSAAQGQMDEQSELDFEALESIQQSFENGTATSTAASPAEDSQPTDASNPRSTATVKGTTTTKKNTTTTKKSTTTTKAGTTTKKPSASSDNESTSTTLMTDKTRRNDFTMRVIGPLTVKVGETVSLSIEVDSTVDLTGLQLSWGSDSLHRTKLLVDGQERTKIYSNNATFIGKEPGISYCGAGFSNEAGVAVAFVNFQIIVTE